jgi:putative membrane protein (TIGR04086 family)
MADKLRGGEGAKSFSVRAVLTGLFLAACVILAGSALVGLLYSLTEWESLQKTVYSFNYISVAVGGVLAGRWAQKLGWIHGVAVAFLYMLILALIGGGRTDLLSLFFSWNTLLALGCGAIGGMIGVNTH